MNGFEDVPAGIAERALAKQDSTDGLLVRASDIVMENATFVMHPYVPMSAVTVVAGIGGLGKSHFTLEVAARATRGQLEGDLYGEPVHVVLATAEDAHAQTMVPRLKAAGADLDKVSLVRQDVAFSLDDLAELDAAMTRERARLLVLDPIVAYMPTKLDAHKDQHARAILAPLAALASKHDAAVIAVMHLNKATDGHSMFQRVSSSVGFLNAARSGLLFAPDPDDEQVRVLAHGKHNLSEPGESRRFRIESAEIDRGDGEIVRTSRIVWLGSSSHTVSDLLRTDHRRDPRDTAERFLRESLAGGSKPVRWLEAAAKEAGISWRTVRRAKDELGIVVDRIGFGGDGSWEWALPHEPETTSPEHPGKWPSMDAVQSEPAGHPKDGQESPASGPPIGGHLSPTLFGTLAVAGSPFATEAAGDPEPDLAYALSVIRTERGKGMNDHDLAGLFNTQQRSFPPPPEGFARWTGFAIRVVMGEATI